MRILKLAVVGSLLFAPASLYAGTATQSSPVQKEEIGLPVEGPEESCRVFTIQNQCSKRIYTITEPVCVRRPLLRPRLCERIPSILSRLQYDSRLIFQGAYVRQLRACGYKVSF